MKQTIISNKTFDEERALYNLENALVKDCTFAGPADGESALKECRNVDAKHCNFSLRYPLWHAKEFQLSDSVMDEYTRAPIWYSRDGIIKDCKIKGIKCVRECDSLQFYGCKITSPEFGWKSHNLKIQECEIKSEYFLFESNNITVDRLKMTGKYSFQYINNLHVKDSYLDTKDAFWHCKNATIENCTVKGEYLGWYSQNLTFINCKIIGTQPLCYCENLKLINCTMEDTDLSFEYSDVDAEIPGNIMSVKNPKSGKISADEIGEIILKDSIMKSHCDIIERAKR